MLRDMALGDANDPIVRPTARVILLDPRDRVLLIRVALDQAPEQEPFWHMPGGMIEPGETYEQTAQRECAEETGISDISVGRWVWRRRHVAQWRANWYDWQERYFLARTEQTAVTSRDMEEIELEDFREHRWWSLAELDGSDETFVPGRLASLMAGLVAGDLPEEPIDTGI